MQGMAHKRDGAEPLVQKRTRQKAERVRCDSRASAEIGALWNSIKAAASEGAP
jgi:hypothetical protein